LQASSFSISKPWLQLFHVLGLCLPVSPLHTTPCSLSFISSQTEDWGYLNEDGELGLAYQGLKQVARSNALMSSCVCFICVPAHIYTPCVSARWVRGTVHIGFWLAVPGVIHLSLCVWAVWMRSAKAACLGQDEHTG
jgi:hypothetical protein